MAIGNKKFCADHEKTKKTTKEVLPTFDESDESDDSFEEYMPAGFGR